MAAHPAAIVLALPNELLSLVLDYASRPSCNENPLFLSRSVRPACTLSSTCRILRARILALEPTLGPLHALFCNFLLLTPVVAGSIPVPRLPPTDDFDALDLHLRRSAASTSEVWVVLRHPSRYLRKKEEEGEGAARKLAIEKFVASEVVVFPRDNGLSRSLVVVPAPGTNGIYHSLFSLEEDSLMEEGDGLHFNRYAFATTSPDVARRLGIETNLWIPIFEEQWMKSSMANQDMGVYSNTQLCSRLSELLHGLVFGENSPEFAWNLTDWQSWAWATGQTWNGISGPNWLEPAPNRPTLSLAPPSNPAAVPSALLSGPRLIDKVRKILSLATLNSDQGYPCAIAQYSCQIIRHLIRRTRVELVARHDLGIALGDSLTMDSSPEACCYRAILDRSWQKWHSNVFYLVGLAL
ncbi:hypothetical protein HDU87_005537 [Geranomyces variabilis]|uniref:F-box domain-containing protein n=1 Tax=Geranomyces variabilis TaxID=109894 RepID=A0AAD5TGL3_9FUNG|nr:hypothetical protein HDU87_005537 [Geranomyces variabilis]